MQELHAKDQRQRLRISCVVPCLNAESYLISALDSVLAAAAPQDEVIAVYDYSTDKTLELLKGYSRRIKIVIRDPSAPRGAAAAINDGFAEATGDIFCWLGADDYMFPWAFDVVRNVFEQLPDVSWITSSQPVVISCESVCSLISMNKAGVSRDYFLDGFTVSGFRRGAAWIQQESTFWRRSLWEQAGGRLDKDVRIVFDLELWARFFEYADLCMVESILGAFRYRRGQLSGNVRETLASARAVLSDARLKCSWRRKPLRELLLLASHKQWQMVRSLGLLLCPYVTVRIRLGKSNQWEINREKFWIY